MKHASYTPISLAVLAAILFGASAPVSKLLLAEIDPITLAGLLYLGCGFGCALLLIIRPRTEGGAEAPLRSRDVPWLAGALLAGGIAAPILLLLGLQATPASTASLLLNFETVATTLIAALAFKEAVGRRVLSAIGLITIATIVLTWNNIEWGVSLGTLGVLGACVLWGVDNNLTRHISGKDPLVIVGIKGFGAGSFSLLLAFVLGRPLPDRGAAFAAMIVGAICYGLSVRFFILALRGLGAARTGSLFGLAPFVGAMISLALLSEQPSLLFWLAMPVMMLGAWLIITESHGHLHFHSALSHEHLHSHSEAHHSHQHSEAAAPPINGSHSHAHDHPILTHDHPHHPDLHHRHQHETSNSD